MADFSGGELIRRLLIMALLLALFPASAAAKEPSAKTSAPESADVSEEPVVTIKPPKSHIYKKILLFPFEIPKYAFRAATFPLGMTSRFIERHNVQERVADFLSNDDKTLWIYPIIEGGAGSSFGGGPALRYTDLFHRGYQLSAKYTIHVNLNQLAAASLEKPDAFEIMGTPVSWSFSPQWVWSEYQYFYGIGNDSKRNDKTQYLLNKTDVAGGIAAHPLKNLSTGAFIGYSLASSGEGAAPSVDTLFPANSLAGFEQWLQYGLAGIKIEHDTRNNSSLPESGGVRTFKFTRYQHFGEKNYSYNQYNLDVKEFIRLMAPRHVLGLHMGWVFEQETGGSQIPFYRLALLDVKSPLRGFPQQRFTDRNMCVFNAEYRFPIWGTMDGVIFGDTGRVFHSVTDFTFEGFKYSAGGGLRMRAMNLMLFRVDIAYGGEGVNVIFGVSKSI